jgi:hypothetical protein
MMNDCFRTVTVELQWENTYNGLLVTLKNVTLHICILFTVISKVIYK